MAAENLKAPRESHADGGAVGDITFSPGVPKAPGKAPGPCAAAIAVGYDRTVNSLRAVSVARLYSRITRAADEGLGRLVSDRRLPHAPAHDFFVDVFS